MHHANLGWTGGSSGADESVGTGGFDGLTFLLMMFAPGCAGVSLTGAGLATCFLAVAAEVVGTVPRFVDDRNLFCAGWVIPLTAKNVQRLIFGVGRMMAMAAEEMIPEGYRGLVFGLAH